MSLKFTFDDHPELKGKHALFSPSQSSWLRYDDDKIAERIINQYRTQLGTEIHDYAATEIDLRHKKKQKSVRPIINEIESFIYNKYRMLTDDGSVPEYATKLVSHLNTIPREVFDALKCYINDGTGFAMTTEQALVYNDKLYGHADTICFRDNFLRIHDLKTGYNPAHMEQLETYAALFVLNYGPKYNFKLKDIRIELRMYQWDAITVHNPTVEDIAPIMDKIISINKIAEDIEKED